MSTIDNAIEIRPATAADRTAIWGILEPVIRAGETYALARDLGEADALAFWMGPGHDVYVAATDGRVVGTYFLRANHDGGGAHVGNCGYMTASGDSGRGVGRAMCAHSIECARARGFRAVQFNFVVSSNERAVRLWQRFGWEIVGRLPGAFRHPTRGYVDAYVMYRNVQAAE
jgi:ribosomal protein S18 acetylase RimI-like enzyme